MRKILIVSVAALGLAGCQTVAQDRALTGAVIGGAAGTGIAAATGGSLLGGAAIGAVAGGVLGAATAPSEPCYVRTRGGRLQRVAC